MLTRHIAKLLVATLALLLPAALFAQATPPPLRPVATEVPFTVISTKNVRFPQPLRLGGTRAPIVDKGLERAFLVRVEVSVAAYDGLPPSIEPFLYIGGRELRTYAVERPPGGKTLYVTYYLPGTADATTFDFGAPMVITIEHGRPTREAARYRARNDLKTFQTQWLRSP
jgi:hypothetical protein